VQRRVNDLYESLIDALAGIPSLPGALCRGRAADFDLEPGSCPEAIEAAIHICESCPVLTRCREYVDSLPPSRRPPGVVAGRLNTYTPRKKVSA
jgi:hypothetical protein